MNDGLEGVVVVETGISEADSENGELWVRGTELAAVVQQHGFEEMVALLWRGLLPRSLSADQLRSEAGREREIAFSRLQDAFGNRALLEPGLGLRESLARLQDDTSPVAIMSTMAVAVPAFARLRRGERPLAPDPGRPAAEDFLRTLHGRAVDPTHVRALDVYWTCMCESGMGASTYAARVVASTRASLVASVLGGYCAFSGPLHGGAPGPALDLIGELMAAQDIGGLVAEKLDAGERLIGFGHRQFPGNDPRTRLLKVELRTMVPEQLAALEHIEDEVTAAIGRHKPGRHLPANVEPAAALLLNTIGIPRDAFTETFTVTRCAAWIAHALEQRRDGRMIRPTSRYVDPNRNDG